MPALWLAAGILLAAAGLRHAAAASGGLWLDEIWSVQLAEALASPFEVIEIRQDNNHPLNTLILSWLVQGRDPSDFVALRMPAILAGVAATAVAGCWALGRSSKEACATMLLVGSSSLLVHYSSEARGYAFAVLFALTSLLAISRRSAGNAGAWCLVFNASVALGILSHFSFVHAYGAMLAWWAWSVRREGIGAATIEFAKWQLLPLLFTFGVYWVYVRALPVAGGPDQEIARLVARTAALSLGVPSAGIWRWIGAALALGIATGAIGWLARRGEDRWVLYASAIFLLPGITLLIQGLLTKGPEFMAPRYFLMAVLFFLLLLGEVAGGLLEREGPTRVAAGFLLLAFVAGNLVQTQETLRNGRGHYWKALMYMANQSRGEAVRVGSDHDIRVGVVLGYYARLLPPGKQLAYHKQTEWPPSGPEWLVQHRHGAIHPLEQQVVGRQGNSYRLEQVLPTGPLSGSHWLIYHNELAGGQ